MRYSDLPQYIKTMAVPGSWFDTPMLLAASAVYEMQILCILPDTDPQVIMAAEVSRSAAEIPVCLLANLGNFHFWACELAPVAPPRITPSPHVIDRDPMKKFSAASLDDGDQSDSEQQQQQQSEPLDAKVKNLYGIAKCLSSWSPFDLPDPGWGWRVSLGCWLGCGWGFQAG